MLAGKDSKAGHHSLYTMGRGFYGQLGSGDYESCDAPKHLCIGYQQCMVSL